MAFCVIASRTSRNVLFAASVFAMLVRGNTSDCNENCPANIRSSSTLQLTKFGGILKAAKCLIQPKTCEQPKTCQQAKTCEFWKSTGGFWISHRTVTEANEKECGLETVTSGDVCGFQNVTDGSACGWITPRGDVLPKPRCEDTNDDDCLECCGSPPLDPLGTVSYQSSFNVSSEVLFPGTVTYECKTAGATFEGKPNGRKTYELNCQRDGTFEHVSRRCEMVACGEPPMYENATRSDGVRFAFDIVSYQCNPSTSVDGLRGTDTWNISCTESGNYLQSEHTSCIPLSTCGVPHEDPLAFFSDLSEVYALETVRFSCTRGSTVGGVAGGATSYERMCKIDGTFEYTNKWCEKVRCGEPPAYEGAARADGVRFAFDQVHYTCNEGTSTSTGLTEWNVSCTEDGLFQPGSPAGCRAVKCGSPRGDPLATFSTADVFFPNSVTYTCKDGATLQGKSDGGSSYQLECKSDGSFKDAGERCRKVFQEALWTVSGTVKDATNNNAVANANIHIMMSSGSTADLVTNAAGHYAVEKVPTGITKFSVEANGFVPGSSELVVTRDIAGEQGGDVFLSPVADSSDDWRIVLKWGRHPDDLDAHLRFTNDNLCHLYYHNTSFTCEGVEATLDVDDQDGFGPETVTIKHFNQASSNLIYSVHLFRDQGSPPKLLDESEATADIYEGNRLAATLDMNIHGYISENKKYWYVARLDQHLGRAIACTNEDCN